MNPWLWLIPAGSFAVLETIALVNSRQGDTLSEVLRKLAGIRPLRPWKPVGVAVIAGSLAWLADHLVN